MAELITAINGRGEIPLKFSYLGKGAERWSNVSIHREESGGINELEGTLLAKRVRDFLAAYSDSKSVNVIDIGCGNGLPATSILQALTDLRTPFKYVPVDISPELLGLAERNLSAQFPNLDVEPVILDFELGNFSDLTYDLKANGSSNLLLFLGATLGNSSDRRRVLANFRDSMSADDYLLLGVELTNFSKIGKLLRNYDEENARDFVYFVPDIMGISRNDTSFEVKWDDRQNQVELRAVFGCDVESSLGSERLHFESGDSLLLARSVKFTEWSITKLLSDVGFRNELLTTNSNRSYLLSMVQPTR